LRSPIIAEEALTIAKDFRDPEAPRMMLEIAERNEKFAQPPKHKA